LEFTPTDEQLRALGIYREGKSLKLVAGAGTGKTATITLLAGADNRRKRYLAFNKAIVVDATAKMPDNTAVSTVHSLAYRAVIVDDRNGRRYKERMGGGRLPTHKQAQIMGTPRTGIPITDEHGTHILQPGTCVRLVKEGLRKFCESGDEVPNDKHIPWQPFDAKANDRIRRELGPCLHRAWADVTDPGGKLQFTHDHYLKMWALQHPVFGVDVVFVDEAQDLSDIMIRLVADQAAAGTQTVIVGDAFQQIYEWRGSVAALGKIPTDETAYLTKSFRFGRDIADIANDLLSKLGAEFRLTGNEAMDSRVEPITEPRVTLFRTNAAAMGRFLEAQSRGKKPHIVGGAKDIIRFAEAAIELDERGYTTHPELVCFSSWQEVVVYARSDELGEDLKKLVDVVEEHGAEKILAALRNMPSQDRADLVLSTAHKAKGLEWPEVALGPDYRNPDSTGPEEKRLLYVACTRAREVLDCTSIPGFGTSFAVSAVRTPAPVPTEHDGLLASLEEEDNEDIVWVRDGLGHDHDGHWEQAPTPPGIKPGTVDDVREQMARVREDALGPDGRE
jgi:AAA domain-containing protein/UvrD-like helicase family protein